MVDLRGTALGLRPDDQPKANDYAAVGYIEYREERYVKKVDDASVTNAVYQVSYRSRESQAQSPARRRTLTGHLDQICSGKDQKDQGRGDEEPAPARQKAEGCSRILHMSEIEPWRQYSVGLIHGERALHPELACLVDDEQQDRQHQMHIKAS